MVLALTLAMATGTPDVPTLKARGFEVLDQIRREYFLPDSKLFCDSIEVRETTNEERRNDESRVQNPKSKFRQSGPAFNWGVGVMLSALNAAARLDPKYKAPLRAYADATRVYWNDKGPVPGYDVLPGPKPVDRYYDDNAWMVLTLVETYEVLGDAKYLDWADEALTYVLSGEDAKLGGGIYWKEAEKASKNTCSNLPSAAACLAVARYRRGPELTARARSLIDWTRRQLQDPADGLFWDNVNLSGRIDRTKWTYNTGLYLTASAGLGSDAADRNRAFQGSLKHWIDSKSGAAKDGGRFVHLWFEGLLAAKPGDVEVRRTMVRALDYAYANARNAEGRYADRWDRPIDPRRTKFELIDQASAARALLVLARAMEAGGEVSKGTR